MPDARFTNDNLDDKMPIDDTGKSHGDPFHYGKKKYYSGYTDGAYATTNVPAGRDKPSSQANVNRMIHEQRQKRRIGKPVILKSGAIVMPSVRMRRRKTSTKLK